MNEIEQKLSEIYTQTNIDLMKKFEDLFTFENPDFNIVEHEDEREEYIKTHMLLLAKIMISDFREEKLKKAVNKFGFIPEQISEIKEVFREYFINDIPY